jgi:hypothetical protein
MAAVKGEETLAELAQQFDINPIRSATPSPPDRAKSG